ncbi:hypothetical protein SCHPADRAFT_940660 [Schizopora paradoxa]|uniref:Uncharacterized protein n=1 Tax=Schizopora paradoxa TaxID=27342 RepID=A0A0H2RUF9_9AGAM|nr:hypothetical protein SCHPADRAFT_940660 [Schizopora paradoxa]
MNQNISVDDSLPDPLSGFQIIYGLANKTITSGTGWNTQDCVGCLAKPDPSQAFNGTWHDASSHVSQEYLSQASFFFVGSAIYAKGIVVSTNQETTGSLNNSRMSFQIDGQDVGSYNHTAAVDSKTTYLYNVTLFAKEDLSYGLHNFTMTCGSETSNSLCLLDRLIYTTQINPNTTSSVAPKPNGQSSATSSKIAFTATQGAPDSVRLSSGESEHVSTELFVSVVAGLTFALICLVGACYLLRRRYERRLKSVQGNQALDGLHELKYHDPGVDGGSAKVEIFDFLSGVTSPQRYPDAIPKVVTWSS